MDYGNAFAKLMMLALQSEESELKSLKAQSCNKNQNNFTVHDYYESWLWPAFLKAAWRDPDCHALDWETGRIDCCFLRDGSAVAAFELKGLFPVKGLAGSYFGKILGDFEKQSHRAGKHPHIEHYVALLPYGDAAEVDSWIENDLGPALAKDSISVTAIPDPTPIELNRDEHGHAFVKVFRVTRAGY